MGSPRGRRVAGRVGNRKHGRAANRVEGVGHRLHVGARDIHDVAAGIAACRPQAMNHDGPHADTLAAYRSIEDVPEGIVAHDAQIERAGWRLESGIRPADEGAELVEIGDRKSVVRGKSVVVRLGSGGASKIKKKKET